MTYAKNSKITAADYNSLVLDVNKVYSVGFAETGLGQTALTQISEGNTVDNTEWDNLGDTITKVAAHQGTAITTIPSINEGDLIQYLSSIENGKNAILNKNWKAAAQGSTTTVTTPFSSSWSNSLTFTHIITFASGDAARYFFNAGGQIAMSFQKNGSAPMDIVWQNLISKMGTLVISAGAKTGSPTATVAGTAYTGFTQISSSSIKTLGRSVYQTDYGYFRLSSVDSVLYSQTAQTTTATTGYGVSYIKVSAKANGPRGINGDNGSTITITTIWDEVPNGLVASAGTFTTVTIRPPSTANINNTWGMVTVSGFVTGS
jgi:hypothetical protein